MYTKYSKNIVVSVLVVFFMAVAAVQPAGATPPEELNFTVDRVYVVPSSSTTFGTWSSTGILESNGGLFESYFFSNWNVHPTIVLSDAQGTITLKAQLQDPQPGPDGAMLWTGRWVIVDGTGDYTGLHARGDLSVSEVFHGTCPVNAYGITGACVIGTETYTGQGHFYP